MNGTVQYLESPVSRTRKIKGRRFKFFGALFSATFFAIISIFGSFAENNQRAEAFDVIQYIMCFWGEDAPPGVIYQLTQSSDMQFSLFSQSSINAGIDDVDQGLNGMLSIFGQDFNETNEPILNRPMSTDSDFDSGEGSFNDGETVNPFDRFGVAGLKFTAYTGEWKHLAVDACGSGDAEDPRAGMFYDGRLEPQSTWEDRHHSDDPRSLQHSMGIGSQYSSSLANLLANWVFSLTKLMVVLTISLINFSMADVTQLLGLTDFLYGPDDSTDEGLFSTLHQNAFMPLLVIMFGITGFWVFMQALRGQFKNSLTGLLRALLMMLIAIILASAPSTFLSIPNNIAVAGQGVMLSALDRSFEQQGDLCNTNIGSDSFDLDEGGENPVERLEAAGENLRSAVSCTFWEMFLVTPWAQGQFESEWNHLWATEGIPEWADEEAETLGNDNDAMVGRPEVPMGGGEFLENWAIFQISTQTNAHSPIEHQGEVAQETSGIANDWWRIVDATSNYSEIEYSMSIPGEESVTYDVPDPSAYTTEHWDQWVGNSSWGRVATAASSVVVAVFGLSGPLVFSFMSTVYAIGISVMVSIAPIMFLLAIGPGNFWELFKSWAQTIYNLVIKRIIIGLLLVLSIIFSMTAIGIMQEDSWWQGMILLVLATLLLIKSRHKLLSFFTATQFASQGLSDRGKKMGTLTKGGAKKTAGVAGAGFMGGMASKRYGGSFAKGAKAASGSQLKNLAYQTPGSTQMLSIYEQRKVSEKGASSDQLEFLSCAHCRTPLSEKAEAIVARDANGNYYCQECFDFGYAPEDAYQMSMDYQKTKEKRRQEKGKNTGKNEVTPEEAKVYEKASKSRFNDDDLQKNRKKVLDDQLSDADREKSFKRIINGVAFDIRNMRDLKDDNPSFTGAPKDVPEEIKSYLDTNLIKEAWTKGNYDYIQAAYTAAWMNWHKENTGKDAKGSSQDYMKQVSKTLERLDKKRDSS